MKVVVGLVEHIGDIVACEPVARYLKLRYPDSHLAWVVNGAYRELIDSNPYVDETIAVDCLTDWIKISRHGGYDEVVDLHVNYRVCSHCRVPLIKHHGNPYINAYEWLDHGTLLEAFTVGAGLPKLSAAPRVYLTERHRSAVDALNLPQRYCVIHRESNNLEKDWAREQWSGLADWIEKNLGLPIVEIGVSKSDALASPLGSRSIDLLNKTSILETAEVIRRAEFFVGVDSGPSHLANAVRSPGLVLLGRMGAFRQYTPYNGMYGSDDPVVKLVRNLTGPARDLPLQEVIEATRYIANVLAARPEKDAAAATVATVGQNAVAPSADRTDILSSSLYDEAWYVVHYPDVETSRMSPLDHFILIGGKRGYAPGPEFDGAGYLKLHGDVAAGDANPLLHYIRFGKREGRALPKKSKRSAYRSTIPATVNSDGDLRLGLSTAFADAPAELAAGPVTLDEVPRTFAFYLPQFHPIAENDWAHGKGFTEWNNVIKAKPLFNGHYQPKLPGELGYYDLRSFDVMREQIELALDHGITGFCFYYYYFHGKKLLFKPIENYIKSDLKAPFFFLWANENWSKRWDGGDQEVIIAQQHSKEDDLAFIRELFPLFEDDRYTKIGGKPLLMIYKPHLFPNMLATVETWRDEAAKHGFEGLYLVMVDDWLAEPTQPRTLGFDASYEIPSNAVPRHVYSDDIKSLGLGEDFTGRIIDYQKFAQYHMSRPMPEYRRFRTVMLPWDNTARYGSRAMVHVNTQGDGYKLWLSQAMLDTYHRYPAEERIVLLHSWNEWCEGTYLEPDGRLGRRYLEQTREAIDDVKSVIALGGTPEMAKALQLLKQVQRRKDEGAFRILQASLVKQATLMRQRDVLRGRLGAINAAAASGAEPEGQTQLTTQLGRVKRRLRRFVGR